MAELVAVMACEATSYSVSLFSASFLQLRSVLKWSNRPLLPQLFFLSFNQLKRLILLLSAVWILEILA